MPTMIGSKEIGGGFVRRAFTSNGVRLKVGELLTPEQINGFVNRRTLISNEIIAVYPPSGESPAERHIVHNGGGRYDVIAGSKLNAAPLSKDEAEELATRPN